jgi:hypothetical protein
MRTTTLAFVSLLSACVAPIGEREHDDFGPDAGVDGSSVTPGACDDLKVVTMNLVVSGTSHFNNLPTTCWKLVGKLTITGPAISSVEKLGDLREVTLGLEINDADLSEFNPKTNVEVGGDIVIINNDKLTNISKVVAKTTVNSIRVEYNPLLTSLGGLSRAATVAAATTISNNAKLTSIDLSSASRLEGGLTIRDNVALTSIQLTVLSSVGPFTIERNSLLTSISNMSSMTDVHGAFTVNDNDALVSLGQFGTGIRFAGAVTLSNNAKLADTGAISHATYITGVVAVNNNLQLDVTRAHDISCCVQTAGLSATGNKTTACQGNHYCINNGQQACFDN